MRVDALLFKRQGKNCITCSDAPPPPCACAPNESCVRIARSCDSCGSVQCVPNQSSSSSGGVSTGALAGGIVGALVFLGIAVGLYFWFRRTSRIRKALAASRDPNDKPAAAEDVLRRPDPMEKLTPAPSVVGTTVASSSTHPETHGPSSTSRGAPLEDPPQYTFRQSNPFADATSIQTAGTEGTNVIPIALVSGDQESSIRSGNSDPSTTSYGPTRPPRSPDLDLNYDSPDRHRLGPEYAGSTISGVSGMSRNSYMSGLTYASEMLNEAPMIMTPTKGPVRQVLGVVKAEVINAGSINGSSSSDSLKPPATYARPTVTSPLASTSFGPNDVVQEVDESLEVTNPFDDKHSSTNANYSISPPPTASMFASGRDDASVTSEMTMEGPNRPFARDGDYSRPSSLSTQAGSVIEIADARKVNVGLLTPATASTTKNVYRTTMGRLVTPSTSGETSGTLEEQQARALAHAQAQAQAQGFDKPRPISGSSVSTRADSILESFPFVPPSPISNRPIRSPPVSPAHPTFGAAASSPLAQHTFVVAPPSPAANEFATSSEQMGDGALPAPPNRRTLGLSTGSQLSTVSTGLGSFPFQIDNGTDRPESTSAPPAALRQRASLDTLALTSDLSSYPLGFDRDSTSVPPLPRTDRK